MSKIPAIAVCHRREDVSAVARSLEHDFCDPRKVLADRISVVGVSRAEFVKINLLIEIQIGFGPLTLPGKTRIINSTAVRVPSRTAARRGILDACNGAAHGFSRP